MSTTNVTVIYRYKYSFLITWGVLHYVCLHERNSEMKYQSLLIKIASRERGRENEGKRRSEERVRRKRNSESKLKVTEEWERVTEVQEGDT